MKTIASTNEYQQIINSNEVVLGYYSHKKCNVCKTLKPKLYHEFGKAFPKMVQIYIDIEQFPEIAAQQSIFTVPVIVVYFEGKESLLKARNFGIDELAREIERPYSIIFG